MDYQTWKEKRNERIALNSRKRFEELQKEYDFHVVKEHKKISKMCHKWKMI